MLNDIRYILFFFPLVLLVITATVIMSAIGEEGIKRFDRFMADVKKAIINYKGKE